MSSFTPSRRPRYPKPIIIALGIVSIVALGALTSAVRNTLEQRSIHNTPNPVTLTPEIFEVAKRNYDLHCASCHGSTGNGKGDKADGLWSKPTDFRDTTLRRRTDGDFFWVTTKGDWPMPAFKDRLSDLERWQLAAYIRTFSSAPAPKLGP